MLHPSRLKLLDREIQRARREGRSPDPRALTAPLGSDIPAGVCGKRPERQWRHAPFILPTHLLDRTQPADLGWTSIEGAHRRWHQDHPDAPRETWPRFFQNPPFPDCPVSHSANLQFDVMGFRILSSQIHGESRREAVLLPELGQKWKWRCRHVYEDGLRCCMYADIGVLCYFHRKYWRKQDMTGTGYAIQDATFRTLVEKHQSDPSIRSVASEVAVMRSVLDMLLGKIKVSADVNEMDPGEMNAVMQTAKMITDACEKMVAIESKLTAKLSVEQLSAIATTMFNAIVEICQPTPDQAHRLAAAFAKATNPKVLVMVDAETGELATTELELERVRNTPVQNRVTMSGGETAYTPHEKLEEKRKHPAHPPKPPDSVARRLTDMIRHGRTWGEQP